MLDLRIDNAKLFDGYNFCDQRRIGIKDGVVVFIGDDATPAKEIIDGSHQLLTPAFVDTHSHADFLVTHDDNDGGSSVSQGVGTLVVGNCGMSSTPTTEPFPLLMNKESDRNLNCRHHLKEVRAGLSLNIGELLGHSTLRMSVLGQARRSSTTEIASMCSVLREYLESGWLGMSVGLNYPEAAGYGRRELLELCKVLAEFDKPLTCHIRDQGPGIIEAMDEVIDVTAEAGGRVLLSHLRPLSNWTNQTNRTSRTNRSDHLVPEMERRFDDNDHAQFDMYPYVAGCTTLGLLFKIALDAAPAESAPFLTDDVDTAIKNSCTHAYADIHVIAHRNRSYVRQAIADIAKRLGDPPGLVVQKVYFEDPSCVCIFDNTSTTDNVDRLIQHDRCLLGSDAWLYPASYQDGACHPRNFGAFTGFLTRYVRDGPIDLISGLRRITSGAADYFGLDAGQIAVGKRADMALFALDKLRENADMQNPCQISAGMQGVWIAGHRVFNDGSMTGLHRPGVRLPMN